MTDRNTDFSPNRLSEATEVVVQISVDTAEVEQATSSITSLLETCPLEDIRQELLDRIQRLVAGGELEVCVTPFHAASVAGHHVIGLRVGGELKEVAAAAAMTPPARTIGPLLSGKASCTPAIGMGCNQSDGL